jgi:uncharacterized protein YecE (DUF72 family)
MKFGKVDDPSSVDFTLPADHPENERVLSTYGSKENAQFSIGCAKWNKSDLKGFYPRGTKDELAYYSSQFNSIELNATFYRLFPAEQFTKWKEKTPANFKFFPKVTQDISQFKRLNEVEELVELYTHNVAHLEEKLGMVFLQMIGNFAPKDFDRVVRFVEYWPKNVPLAIELRHTDWYNDSAIANELYQLYETHGITNVIVDTAGRRDLMHMRHTSAKTFIRYTGANHESDYTRLDDWVIRIKEWIDQGMDEINFFVHQNIEKESPLLSAYFIEKLNKTLNLQLQIPAMPNTLF